MTMYRTEANAQATTQALLIDLDGTLVDSAPDIVTAANHMLRELNAPPLPFETVSGFIGKGVPNLVRRVLESRDSLSGIAETDAQAIFYKHYRETNGRFSSVYPGVLAGLDAFQRAGFRLACVTNKPLALTEALLRLMGLASYFEVIVAGDSLPEMKPHPSPLFAACAQLGVKPWHSVLIGDSGVDAAAAQAAGMPVYLVSYGYPGPNGVGVLKCEAVIDSFIELPALLAGEKTA
jgi:phosphoglycolate phosphatase